MKNMPTKIDDSTLPIIKQIAESMPGGFFIYRATGDENFIYVNSATLRIFGCKDEGEFRTLTKNSFRHMVHPDDIEEVEKSIAEQIKNSVHDLDYVEYRIIRKDGAVRWIIDYGHLVHTETYGDVFFVFIDDATAKRELELEERRKQSVIEGLSSGFNSIYLVNTQDDTMMPYAWNDPVSKEMVEQTFHNSITETNFTQFNTDFAKKYIAQDDRQKYLETVSLENVREKIANREEILYVFRGGHIKENESQNDYVQLSISPVSGTRFLAVMAMKTVTEQMQKIKADALEKLLIEQERDNAIHANNAKSTFLFNMSHDLKTPINAIAGFAELARKNVEGDKQRINDYLEKIRISSDVLVELINDVLSMTEIESGNLTLKEEPCDLEEQIKVLSDMFRPQISAKNLDYTTTLKIKHNNVVADSLNLKRVLSNLLQNSVNFTAEHGAISLSVEESPSEKEGFFNYRFTLSDTGCGMSEEFMKRMYTAFEREQNTTASHVAGTGLGLTITKNLVEAMRGKIEAESQVNKGTTFKITIPLRQSTKEDLQKMHEGQPEKSWQGLGNKKTKRVLLVEDNELNREIALEILRECGFDSDAACDGQEAVEIFASHIEGYYDLILMDIQMPRMNGYEATRAIRALPRNDIKTIPIFALTANTLDQDKMRAYESGMNKVIEKPVNMSFFANLLESL